MYLIVKCLIVKCLIVWYLTILFNSFSWSFCQLIRTGHLLVQLKLEKFLNTCQLDRTITGNQRIPLLIRNCNILIIPGIIPKPTMNQHPSRQCADLFFHAPVHLAYRRRQVPLSHQIPATETSFSCNQNTPGKSRHKDSPA